MAIPEQHRAWFIDVCKQIGMEGSDAEDAIADNGFVVNDTQPVFFTPSVSGDQNSLVLYGAVALLPETEDEKLGAMLRSLTYQWLVAGPHASTVGLDTEDDVVMLTQTIYPAEIPPETMPGILRMFTRSIELFRTNVLAESDAGKALESAGIDPALLVAQEQQKYEFFKKGI